MNIDKIRVLFDKEQRREVQYFKLQREVTPHVVRLIAPAGGDEGSMVIYSRLTPANVEAVIGEQVAYFEGIGHKFEWKLYDYDTPVDLKDRLAAHGFKIEDPEAVLVLDLNEAPPALLQPVTLDVRRIEDPAKIVDVMAVQSGVWSEDFTRLGRRLAENLREDPAHLGVYVAYAAGTPVSAAWIEFHDESQFAGLWGGSTLPDYRRQGFYTALVATRLQEARRREVRFLTIDASPMSRPILEKFGFRLLSISHPCKWQVGGASKETE